MPDIQFPWALPRRKTLAPDGSYRDSPYVSDANGITGQGPLYDNSGSQYDQDLYNQDDTVTRHSPNYSDNPPPVKPTESSTSPTTAQTNPTWAAGDRIPGGPPGYTPQTQAGPIRPLYEGMTPPKAYTDYQEAIHDPGLHPKTSAWRQILGGVVGNVASGILSPLGDVVRYGGQGARDLRDAQYRLGMAEEARKAQLAQDRESETAANQAYLREQQRQQNNAANYLRQQEINRRIDEDASKAQGTWEGQMTKAGATPMPEGISLQDPSTGYVPSMAPPSPQAQPAIPPRPPLPSQSPSPGPDISTLPTRTFNPGTYLTPQMQIPKGYGISMPPPTTQMQPSGRLSMVPPPPSAGMVIPPRSVAEQQHAEMLGKEVIPTPANLVDEYGPNITRDQLSKAITAGRAPKPEKKDDTYWLNVVSDPKSPPELVKQGKDYLARRAGLAQSMKISVAGPPADPATVKYWANQVQRDAKNWAMINGDKALSAGVRQELTNRGHNVTQLDAMTRDTAAISKKALTHIPKIEGAINSLEKSGELGVIASRWNSFMTGTVGTGNPQFDVLRKNVKLLSSAMGRAHGGARGGGSPAMIQYMNTLLSADKMDPVILRSSLGVIKDWLTGYANMAEGIDETPTGGGGGGTGGDGTGGTVPQVGQQFNGGKVLKVTPIP